LKVRPDTLDLVATDSYFANPLKTYNSTIYPRSWSNGSLGREAVDEVSLQFFTLFGTEAAFMFIIFLMILLFFPAHAEYAPSVSESKKRQKESDNAIQVPYCRILMKMMKTTKWVFIVISTGMSYGPELSRNPDFGPLYTSIFFIVCYKIIFPNDIPIINYNL